MAKNPATAAPAVSAAPLRTRALLVRPPADFPAVPWDMNRSPEPLENHLIPGSKGSDGPLLENKADDSPPVLPVPLKCETKHRFVVVRAVLASAQSTMAAICKTTTVLESACIDITAALQTLSELVLSVTFTTGFKGRVARQQ